MKNRFLKKKLYSSHKHVKSAEPPAILETETTETNETTEIEDDQDVPIVTSKKANPFDLLFKEVKPIPEVISESIEPKKRGRPRKALDENGTKVCKDDDEEDPREITVSMRNQMIEDFRKMYVVDEKPLEMILTSISKKFRITYSQAHMVLEKEM